MISSHWIFKDFVDESGRNVIHGWVLGIPKKAQQRFIWLLKNLENTPPPLTRVQKVAALEREGKGLIEIIFEIQGVQYRPLGFYGPNEHEITLLLGATKKSAGKRNQTVFDPSNACALGLRRRQIVLSNPTQVIDHDYSTT